MERDSQPESLAGCGDPEAHQGRVLTGAQGGARVTAGAEGGGPLVQAELVVLQSGEHLAVQLPAVKQLGN